MKPWPPATVLRLPDSRRGQCDYRNLRGNRSYFGTGAHLPYLDAQRSWRRTLGHVWRIRGFGCPRFDCGREEFGPNHGSGFAYFRVDDVDARSASAVTAHAGRFRLCGRVVSIAVIFFVSWVFLGSSAQGGAATVAPQTALSSSLPELFSGCDPVGANPSSSTVQALSLVLPQAFTSTPKGTIIQATSFLDQAEVQSLKPLVIMYSINKGAKWVDNRAIGLSDFVSTWKWGAKGVGPAAIQYRQIQSIKKGKSTSQVLVRFSTPTSNWRALFSPLLPATVSRSALTSCSIPSGATDLSAGPYVIASGSPSVITLVPNPRWWGPAPAFTQITLSGRVNASVSQFTTPLQVGLAEATWFPSGVLEGIVSEPGVSSRVDFSNRIVSLDFATLRSGVPLGVRQAISLLINRPLLIQDSVGQIDTSITPATSHLIAQGQPNYTPLSASPATDSTTTSTTPVSATSASRAKKALTQAGYHLDNGVWVTPQGQPFTLTTSVPLDDYWSLKSATIIREQLGAQGIKVRLSFVSSSVVVAQNVRSAKTMSGIVARPTDLYAAHSAGWFTTSPVGPNSIYWAGYQKKSLNTLAKQASMNMNPTDAVPLYETIDNALWSAMPSLPLFTEPDVLAWSTDIDGVVLDPYPPGTLSALLSWKLISATAP